MKATNNSQYARSCSSQMIGNNQYNANSSRYENNINNDITNMNAYYQNDNYNENNNINNTDNIENFEVLTSSSFNNPKISNNNSNKEAFFKQRVNNKLYNNDKSNFDGIINNQCEIQNTAEFKQEHNNNDINNRNNDVNNEEALLFHTRIYKNKGYNSLNKNNHNENDNKNIFKSTNNSLSNNINNNNFSDNKNCFTNTSHNQQQLQDQQQVDQDYVKKLENQVRNQALRLGKLEKQKTELEISIQQLSSCDSKSNNRVIEVNNKPANWNNFSYPESHISHESVKKLNIINYKEKLGEFPKDVAILNIVSLRQSYFNLKNLTSEILINRDDILSKLRDEIIINEENKTYIEMLKENLSNKIISEFISFNINNDNCTSSSNNNNNYTSKLNILIDKLTQPQYLIPLITNNHSKQELQIDLLNHKKQLSSYKEKIAELENELMVYKKEHDSLNKGVQQIKQENNNLKSDLQLSIQENSFSNQGINELTTKITTMHKELIQSNNKNKELNDLISNYENRIEHLTKTQQQLNLITDDLKRTVSENESIINSLREELALRNKQSAEQENIINEISRKLELKEEENYDLKQEINNNLLKQMSALKANIEKTENIRQLTTSEFEHEREYYKKEIECLNKKTKDLLSEKHDNTVIINSLKQDLEVIHKKNLNFSLLVKEQENEIYELQKESQYRDNQLNQIKLENEKLSKDVISLQQEIESLVYNFNNNNNTKNDSLTNLSNKLKTLENENLKLTQSNEELKITMIEKNTENDMLNNQIKKKQLELSTNENKIISLTQIKDEYLTKLKLLEKENIQINCENASLKNKEKSLEKSLDLLEKVSNNTSRKINQLEEISQYRESELSNEKKINTDLNLKVSNLKVSLNEYKDLIKKVEEENGYVKDKNKELMDKLEEFEDNLKESNENTEKLRKEKDNAIKERNILNKLFEVVFDRIKEVDSNLTEALYRIPEDIQNIEDNNINNINNIDDGNDEYKDINNKENDKYDYDAFLDTNKNTRQFNFDYKQSSSNLNPINSFSNNYKSTGNIFKQNLIDKKAAKIGKIAKNQSSSDINIKNNSNMVIDDNSSNNTNMNHLILKDISLNLPTKFNSLFNILTFLISSKESLETNDKKNQQQLSQLKFQYSEINEALKEKTESLKELSEIKDSLQKQINILNEDNITLTEEIRKLELERNFIQEENNNHQKINIKLTNDIEGIIENTKFYSSTCAVYEDKLRSIIKAKQYYTNILEQIASINLENDLKIAINVILTTTENIEEINKERNKLQREIEEIINNNNKEVNQNTIDKRLNDIKSIKYGSNDIDESKEHFKSTGMSKLSNTMRNQLKELDMMIGKQIFYLLKNILI